MRQDSEILRLVRQAAARRLLFLPHAVPQMSRPDRMISAADVRSVATHGKVIEDYPEDVRRLSCLLLGHSVDRRPIHVVCAPKDKYLAIVTDYLPSPEEWHADFRTRRRP